MKGTTVAVALHPKDILQSFMNLLPLYETGIYEMALPNPTPNATTFGNLPVHRSDTEVDDGEQEDDHGFIVLRYEFGTPEGGWAEPSVFEAIRAKLAANRSFVNGMRERRPFGGRPAYERDGLLLQFDSNAHGCYRLRRLSTTDGPGSTGTPAGRQRIGRIDSAETIALIDTADFHRAVVNGIVDAVSQELGSPGALSPNAFSVLRGPDEVLALTLDHHRHRAARAREQALRTSDSATSEAFRQDAEREDRRILELTAQATESAEIEPSTPGSAEVEAAPLLETLAKLALTGQKVPGAIFTACSQIIPGLQLFPMGRHDEVGWSAQVRLPTVSGDVLVFDEIQGSVPCRGVRSPPSRRRQRDAGVLEEYASGAPLEAIAQRHGVAVSRVWTLARASLIEAQIPESTLARLGSAPIPELRALVGTVAIRGLVREAKAHMNDLVALADLLVAQGAVPQGAAPQWAASTIAHYLGPLSARSKWSAPNVLGQAAVDAVESDGGVITVRRLCQQVGPLAQSNSVAIAHVLGFGTISQPAVLEPVTVVDKSAGGRYNPEAELQLVKCPHCAGVATLVLRITELPRHLLCRSCGRSPTASFVYPASYLALPSGLHHFPGVSWLSRYRAGTEGTNPRPPRPALTDADKRALVADYQDHSKPVLGPGGIVEKYQVSAGRMYQVIDEAGIQRRRPYRPRGT